MPDNAVELFKMEIAHIGINASNEKEGNEWAEQFLSLMGLPKRETSVSYFSGELIEVMKQNGRGAKGHIGFRVNNCEKAIEYFVSKGMHIVEDTKKTDDDGHCTFVYFEEQIGGFAIHLIQA